LPENIPATFPSKQSNFLSLLQMLALNSPFWSSATESDWHDRKWLTSFYGKNFLITSSRSPSENPEEEDLLELSERLLQNKKLEEKEACDINHTTDFADLEQDAWSKNRPILYTHVCEESVKFLYKTKDFMAEFNAMTMKRKSYFRLLVLLQLQDVDRRLKCANKNDAVRCHIFSLYYTTLALLDSERAMKDNSFGVSRSENGQKTGWSVLNVDDGPRDNIIVRRFETLKSLGSFFDTLDPLQLKLQLELDYDDTHLRRKLNSIFKSQLDPFQGLSSHLTWEPKVLLYMKTILDSCYNTISKRGWVRPPNLNVVRDKVDDQSGKSREHSEEEANSTTRRERSEGWKQLKESLKGEENSGRYGHIDWRQELKIERKDRIQGKKKVFLTSYDSGRPKKWELEDIANHIIFRSILLCLLFCTAPDTSDMLSSGIWEHVIPII